MVSEVAQILWSGWAMMETEWFFLPKQKMEQSTGAWPPPPAPEWFGLNKLLKRCRELLLCKQQTSGDCLLHGILHGVTNQDETLSSITSNTNTKTCGFPSAFASPSVSHPPGDELSLLDSDLTLKKFKMAAMSGQEKIIFHSHINEAAVKFNSIRLYWIGPSWKWWISCVRWGFSK